MNINVTKQPNAELLIHATIEKDKVAQTYEKIVDQIVLETEIKGFRKGKAPKSVVLEKIDVSKVHGEVISALLKEYYPQIMKEKSIFPYSSPKVDVKEFEIGKDFIFELTVAVKPEITMPKYEKIIEKKSKDKALTSEEIVDAILEETKFELSELMVNEETDRLLERFISQIRTLNLNVDQLLKAQNKTYEDLLADHKAIAEKNIKSEFILMEVVKDHKLEATEEEIADFVKNLGDENLANRLLSTDEKWYVKGVIEKNKALDYLKSLVVFKEPEVKEEIKKEENNEEK
jgi:FKBP-type peptidyl-prolyl cis-trans isomerase (trigger factor)